MPLTPQQAKEAFEAKKYEKLQEELKKCYKEIDEALRAGKREIAFNGLTKEAEQCLTKTYASFNWLLTFNRAPSVTFIDVDKVIISFGEVKNES